MDAIEDSVASHEELQSFILMKDESVGLTLDLAGLEQAPGLYNDVTQNCRLVFTDQKRLVFTQVCVYGLLSPQLLSKSPNLRLPPALYRHEAPCLHTGRGMHVGAVCWCSKFPSFHPWKSEKPADRLGEIAPSV